jgi:hypothetical protein
VKASFGPSGVLLSRTATAPGRFHAISTHWPPLALL